MRQFGFPCLEPFNVPSDFSHLFETFENPYPGRNYKIEHTCPEFTSVCPKTGQPDFGTLVFTYTPGDVCIELKSLKLYLQAYRNEGIFYEHITNRIADDFVEAAQPRWMRLESRWTPRGGLSSVITVEYPEPSVP